MAGYNNAGVNDGQFVPVSGVLGAVTIDKPGTYLYNGNAGLTALNTGTTTVASGVFSLNGGANAFKIVDISGNFATNNIVVTGAQGANITFNGALTKTLSTNYQTATFVMYSGNVGSIGGNFII